MAIQVYEGDGRNPFYDDYWFGDGVGDGFYNKRYSGGGVIEENVDYYRVNGSGFGFGDGTFSGDGYSPCNDKGPGNGNGRWDGDGFSDVDFGDLYFIDTPGLQT